VREEGRRRQQIYVPSVHAKNKSKIHSLNFRI
jgi:hypothetical protein